MGVSWTGEQQLILRDNPQTRACDRQPVSIVTGYSGNLCLITGGGDRDGIAFAKAVDFVQPRRWPWRTSAPLVPVRPTDAIWSIPLVVSFVMIINATS